MQGPFRLKATTDTSKNSVQSASPSSNQRRSCPKTLPRKTNVVKHHWLVKQEPEAYSWDTFLKEGKTAWTGVRNFQARNNLRAMKVGDPVLFYHSGKAKEVVALARVE